MPRSLLSSCCLLVLLAAIALAGGAIHPLPVAAATAGVDTAAKGQNPSAERLSILLTSLARDLKGNTRLKQVLQQFNRQLNPELLSTALLAAVEQDSIANARVLLEHRATPNGVDASEPAVVSIKSVAMAELLSRYTADFNQADSKGMTALLYAVKQENLALVRWLLRHGADPNHTAKNGIDPLWIAKEGGLPELIAILEKAGSTTTGLSPVLWASHITESDGGAIYGFASGPLIVGNLLVVGHGNGYLYALDRASGALRWKRNLGGEIRHSPRLVDGDLFVTADSHTLTRLKPSDGSVVWKFTYRGTQVAGGAQLWRDQVLLADHAGNIWAVDRATGKQRWHKQVGELKAVIRGEDALRVVGDGAYFLTKQGLNRYDLVTGKMASFAVAEAGMPEVAQGLAFLVTKNKALYVLDEISLQQKQNVTLESAGLVRPFYHNNRLFVSTETALLAFPVRNSLLRKVGIKPLGKIVWQFETGDGFYARPVVGKYWLITYRLEPEKEPVPGYTSVLNLVNLVALDPATGKEHEKVRLQESYLYSDRMVTPAVDGNVVYAAPLGPSKRLQAVKVGTW